MAANVILRLLKKSILVFIGVIALLSNGSAMTSPETYFSGSQLLLAKVIVSGDRNAVASLAKETELNKPGRQDMTLLFYALNAARKKDAKHLNVITELVKAGANPLQEVAGLGSVANVAASSDSSVFIEALINGGMSPNAMSFDQPIIFSAANENSFEVLKFLLDSGANVNEVDTVGKSVLMEAMAGMQLDQVEYLLKKGANPNLASVVGLNFPEMLKNKFDQENGSRSVTENKLEEIRKLAISKGMK